MNSRLVGSSEEELARVLEVERAPGLGGDQSGCQATEESVFQGRFGMVGGHILIRRTRT